MPREEYDFLTDATDKVLMGNQKGLAIAWDKCQQYISQILTGDKKDPFAFFRSLYAAACKAGISTSPWDNDLANIRQTYSPETPSREVTDAVQDTFHTNGQLFEKYLRAIADGKLTLEELDELEPIVEIQEGVVKVLRKAMREHRARLTAHK